LPSLPTGASWGRCPINLRDDRLVYDADPEVYFPLETTGEKERQGQPPVWTNQSDSQNVGTPSATMYFTTILGTAAG
jgi:hypothetical protein